MDKCKHCLTNVNNSSKCNKQPAAKRCLEKRLEKVAAKDSSRATKLNPCALTIFKFSFKQKFRADPSKREHENAFCRERRAKKRQQTSNGPSPSSNRRRLDNKSSASMYYDGLLR
ncbi:hypothetical protein CDAR_568461 [Caerostris darwini]|uniref:Uncharacterized protein n=1 Tax=Caerostris darwini TaxID=1538125 RepID=A0AAV4TXT1_9ARAC|nr:hypothetical protein CDAR_568461 [Caerostris darwini]